MVLMGIGPLLPWRRAMPEHLTRNFALPASAGALGALSLTLLGVRDPGALAVFALAAFVAATIAVEVVRGAWVRARHGESVAAAILGLFVRNRRRYGGYVVHLGVLFMLVGIAASSAFATQGAASLRAGERMRVGRYTLEYVGLTHDEQPGIDVTEATVRVWAGMRPAGLVVPQRYFYRAQGQPMHQVAIRSSIREDLYVILSEWAGDGRVTLRVLVHPMVSWLWAGGFVLVLGVLVASWPHRRRGVPATATETVLVYSVAPLDSSGGAR
jgi:cytochrome c-type biogenesis protein CcmF